jgi:hypothetical protein
MSPRQRVAIRSAAFAITLWLVAQAAHTMILCGPHRAWTRVRAGGSPMVLDRSERIARPGDAIFACETVHRTGPIVWHIDLDCYCAPASMSAEAVGEAFAGSCTVDKLTPTPSDDAGACRYGRCSRHLN